MDINAAFTVAHNTTDAYSFIRFGWSGWQELTRLMLKHGLTPAQAEAVLRSKWTRWAADEQSGASRFGRMSGRKAFQFLVTHRALRAEELAELVAA